MDIHTLYLPVYRTHYDEIKDQKQIYVNLSLPGKGKVLSVSPHECTVDILSSYMMVYRGTTCMDLTPETVYEAGDYNILLIVSSIPSDQVIMFKIQIQVDISILYMYQLLVNFGRCMKLNTSRYMNQVSQPPDEKSFFSNVTNSLNELKVKVSDLSKEVSKEVEKVSEEISKVSEEVSKVSVKVEKISEKVEEVSNTTHIDNDHLDEIVSKFTDKSLDNSLAEELSRENKKLYELLKEAEDYIESLEE